MQLATKDILLFEDMDPAYFSPSCEAALVEKYQTHGGRVLRNYFNRSNGKRGPSACRGDRSDSPDPLELDVGLYFLMKDDPKLPRFSESSRPVVLYDAQWVHDSLSSGRRLNMGPYMIDVSPRDHLCSQAADEF